MPYQLAIPVSVAPMRAEIVGDALGDLTDGVTDEGCCALVFRAQPVDTDATSITANITGAA